MSWESLQEGDITYHIRRGRAKKLPKERGVSGGVRLILEFKGGGSCANLFSFSRGEAERRRLAWCANGSVVPSQKKGLRDPLRPPFPGQRGESEAASRGAPSLPRSSEH